MSNLLHRTPTSHSLVFSPLPPTPPLWSRFSVVCMSQSSEICLRLTSFPLSTSPVIFRVSHKLWFTYLNDSFKPSGSVCVFLCALVCLLSLLLSSKMRMHLINSPESSGSVWHVLVKTSAVVYKGAHVPDGGLWHVWVSVLFDVSVVAVMYTLLKYEHQGSNFLWPFDLTYHTLSDVKHSVSLSPEPAETLLFTCWDSLYLVSSQGVSCLLFYDFQINSPWKLKAAFWILHQGVRGMDNKRHSFRNNEEKQNANALWEL